MSGRLRCTSALVWLLFVGCHSSSFKIAPSDGAAGQGATGIAGGATAGTGGQSGGGATANADAGGDATAGAHSDASAAVDTNLSKATDSDPQIDAPVGGQSLDGGGGPDGSTGAADPSGSDAGKDAIRDVGLDRATALGDTGAITRDAPVASGDADAAGDGAFPSMEERTTFTVPQSAVRALDLLFVVDNSPSMDAKQKALAASFPALMTALQSLPVGLPDLHVGVISSDMGAGQGEAGGNCAVVLGNQGILWGNDPTVDPEERSNKFATIKNISSLSGNLGCGMDVGARWIENVQSSNGLERRKNYQGTLPEVFSCLSSAVGTIGCGYEHPLQAIRVALNPQPGMNPQNVGFLRRNAFLAIVIVTDEDDCSADPNTALNDGMFAPRTLGDTASMRCAVRGHVCNGLPIPNYDPTTGYTGTAPFVANFEDCDAKDDPDQHNLPLLRIRDMIDAVKQVKDRPEEQILVSGIIGWPKNGDLIGVQYRVDKDLTSMPVDQQKLWDIMPICTLPNVKAADGNIYKAYGGLRLKRFIEGFGAHGRTYSICESDLAPVMTEIGERIGTAVAQKLWPACVPRPLMDADEVLPGIQPDCEIKDGQPCDTPGQGSCLPTGYQETALPQCLDDKGDTLDPNSPNLMGVPDDDTQRPCWYLSYDHDPDTGCPNAPQGQRISVLRRSTATFDGSILSLSCRTCPTAEGGSRSCAIPPTGHRQLDRGTTCRSSDSCQEKSSLFAPARLVPRLQRSRVR